jgi:hypothetical protein
MRARQQTMPGERPKSRQDDLNKWLERQPRPKQMLIELFDKAPAAFVQPDPCRARTASGYVLGRKY